MTTINPEHISEVASYLTAHLKKGWSLEYTLATIQRVYGDQDQPVPIDPHPKPYVAPTHRDRKLDADIQQAVSQKFAQETHESIRRLRGRIHTGRAWGKNAALEIQMREKMEQEARAEAQDIAVRDVIYEWAAGLPNGRFVALLETTGLTGYIQATPEEHISLAKEVLARVRRD